MLIRALRRSSPRIWVPYFAGFCTIQPANALQPASSQGALQALPKVMSLLEPTLERSKLTYQDSVDLLWEKVRLLPMYRMVPFLTNMVGMGEITCKNMLLAIVYRLRKQKKYKYAIEVMNWIILGNLFEVDLRDKLVQLELFTLLGHMDIAEMLFLRLSDEERTRKAYSLMLNGYIMNEMLDKAEAVMDQIRQLNQVTTHEVKALVSLYSKMGLEDKIPALFEEARSRRLELNASTVNAYLRVQLKEEDMSKMETVFEELENRDRSNALTYIIMATGYCSFGLPTHAKLALKLAEAGLKHGWFKRDRNTYSQILQVYGQLKSSKGVERIWSVLSLPRYMCVKNYLRMLEALGNLGDVERAEQIFDQIPKDGLGDRPYIAMVGVYCKQGLMKKALELMKQMPRKTKNVQELYHHLVLGYLAGKDLDQAQETFKRGQSILENRFTPLWYETMLKLMDAHAGVGDVEACLEVFKHCKSAKNYNDIRMFNVLLRTYLTAGCAPHGVLPRMMAMNFEPDQETRRLLSELSPIREEFYKDRFERKIFGKPQFQFLRRAHPEVQRRFAGRRHKRNREYRYACLVLQAKERLEKRMNDVAKR